MYPFVRMCKEIWLGRKKPTLRMNETHVSFHRCWPQDIDFAMELNNGRTLTLLDLGRVPLAMRFGLVSALLQNKWSMTMAGVSVRYRRRIRTFERFEMRSRAIGWDNRFMYIEQSMFKMSGEAANHALYRVAVTDKNGIVPPPRVAEAMGYQGPSPVLPDWVQAWIEAENTRVWPPFQDS